MKFSEGLRKGLAIREKLGRPYCAAVIVAAGSSSRMGGTNKILTVLEKLPVICRTPWACPSETVAESSSSMESRWGRIFISSSLFIRPPES